MAYNFNNTLAGIRNQSPEEPASQHERAMPDVQSPGLQSPDAAPPSAVSPTPIPLVPVTSDNPESAAGVRFRSCRWMQKEESGNQAFCTHREVKPYAGMQGFDPEAWCPECQYYKLRRAPRKRDDSYTY